MFLLCMHVGKYKKSDLLEYKYGDLLTVTSVAET